MRTENEGAFGGIIAGFKHLFVVSADSVNREKPKDAAGRSATSTVLSDFDQALQQVREQAVALRARNSVVDSTEESTNSISRDDLFRRIKEVHQLIFQEIIELHKTLRTGITEETISSAVPVLEELEVLDAKRGNSCEDSVRAALVKKVVNSSAVLAWKALDQRLQSAKITWPEPASVSPLADDEARQRACEREVAEIQDAFVKSSPGRISHRMRGIVDVWQANYPAPDSSVWRQMVLQAIGFGLLARAITSAVFELQKFGPELKEQTGQLLKEQLLRIQEALRQGISSVEEADIVARGASQICEEIVPEIAWERVKSTVEAALAASTAGA